MPPVEKRRHSRVAVNLPATFAVMIPEATFQPFVESAIVSDLSESGAMVRVKLKESTYKLLLQKTRYCRLTFEGNTGLPERVAATAVWIQPLSSADGPEWKIGLFFEELDAQAQQQLRDYIGSFAESAENGASRKN